eukprot:3033948-Amphidinium_carterae.1
MDFPLTARSKKTTVEGLVPTLPLRRKDVPSHRTEQMRYMSWKSRTSVPWHASNPYVVTCNSSSKPCCRGAYGRRAHEAQAMRRQASRLFSACWKDAGSQWFGFVFGHRWRHCFMNV